MRIGIVCPYAWDSPGGVVAHVHDLARVLQRMGHVVSVLAPSESDEHLPSFVTSTGRPRSVRYNGSVAKLAFGPVTASRVSRWISEGEFDVLHVHEPLSPSLSVLACWAARGPIVATWHSSMERSRMLLAMSRLALTAMEKVSARIAVSEAARSTLVQHIGGDAIVIPNGVDVSTFACAHPLPGWPGNGGALVFLGRINEPRKGLDLLLDALPAIQQERPSIRLLIAGPGDIDEALQNRPAQVAAACTYLGRISDEDKPNVIASGDIYIAPNTGGESFGIVLLEAMAAGTPVLASGIEAFQRVLDGGRAGRTFHNGDSDDLAHKVLALMDDVSGRSALAHAGRERATLFDWGSVAARVVEVYESVAHPGEVVEPDMSGQMLGRFASRWD